MKYSDLMEKISKIKKIENENKIRAEKKESLLPMEFPNVLDRIPLYLVVGEEFFLRNYVLQPFRYFLGGESVFFKLLQPTENDFTLQNFWNDVYSQPLFEDWNLVILRDADKAEKESQKSEGTKKKGSKTFQQQIEEYITTISKNSQTTIVLELGLGKKDLEKSPERRKKTIEKKPAKKGKKTGAEEDSEEEKHVKHSWKEMIDLYPNLIQVIECYTPKAEHAPWERNKNAPTELELWLEHHCRAEYQLDITPEARHELITRIGDSLGGLDAELKNLKVYLQDRKKISYEDVLALVQATAKIDPYHFWDVVISGNTAEAYSLYYSCFKQGIASFSENIINENAIAATLFAVCHNKLNELWIALVSQDWGNKTFLKTKIEAQATHFTPEHLGKIWNKLLQADLIAKLNESPTTAVLELMQCIWSMRK